MSHPVDALALEIRDGGVVLPVKAQPGAKKDAVVGVHAGALKVAVAAAPEQGKANRAVVDLLADEVGLKKSEIELLSGQTSRAKKLLLRGVSPDELRERLKRSLA